MTAIMAAISTTLMKSAATHDLVARRDRRQAGQDEIGRKGRDERQDDDDEARSRTRGR